MGTDNQETGNQAAEIESNPEYTPIRISQRPQTAEFRYTDRILLARARNANGTGPNAAYTTVTQALSGLSAQIYKAALAAVAEKSSIISARADLPSAGDDVTILVAAPVINQMNNDIGNSVRANENNWMTGNNIFSFSPVFSPESPSSISSIGRLSPENFITYGQVQTYASQLIPAEGLAYSPDTKWNIISSFTNKAGNKPKKLDQTYQYRVQTDCELHLWLESVADKKIKPSSMQITVKSSQDGAENLVYVFPDNDQEAYVSYYWQHAFRAGMYVKLTHSLKEGNGWYLRRIMEVGKTQISSN